MVVQDSTDAGNTRVGVQLEPFLHQVGGHLSVMQYDEHTVCKPLISQEQRFYESLPLAMKRFTPQYKGTITVHLQRDSRGHLSLIANPLKENQGPFKVSTESAAVTIWQTLQQTTGGISSGNHSLAQWQHAQLTHSLKESAGKTLLRSEFHFKAEVSSLVEDTSGSQAERKSFNPWGLHCHQAHLTRLCSEYPENKRHRFLLLENVVSQYKHPCILDLKMGTRQHGDDASEEKKARHMRKCAQSTSACLGVRICGMQIAEPEACDQMYESLARLHSNYYKHKYPRPRDTSFSGLSLEEYKLILSTDTLEELKEMNKGTWKKLQEKFAPKSPEELHKAWARSLSRPQT
ncbi:inositol hexakisphosphate kinase 3 [Orycteropus afer afer]|uniref:Inositol hexakisphosphate kinase 3 n=1 Tax=Orycteropus afer afer TaxID=1230840 RepID=A0AC54Z8W8_ORYAF|nr:inositol hexakisphosphate kinase 3 [Orycteropus afer afer]